MISISGATFCTLLRGTPPPMVKIPKRFEAGDEPNQFFAVPFQVHQDRLLAAPPPFDVVNINVVPQLRVDESRHEHRHAMEISRFQNAAIVRIIFRKMLAD